MWRSWRLGGSLCGLHGTTIIGNFPLIGRNIMLLGLRTRRERMQTTLVCRGLRCSFDRRTWPKKVVSSAVAASQGRDMFWSSLLDLRSVATLAAKIFTQQRSWSQARLRFMFPTMCTRQPNIFLSSEPHLIKLSQSSTASFYDQIPVPPRGILLKTKKYKEDLKKYVDRHSILRTTKSED